MNEYEWWNGGGCLVECEPLCIVYLCALHKHGLLCPAVVHCVVCVLSFIDSYVRRWNAWSPTVFSSLKCIKTYHILYDLASKTYSCATNAPSISLRRLMPGKKCIHSFLQLPREEKAKRIFWYFACFMLLGCLILVGAALAKSQGSSKKDEQNTGQVAPKSDGKAVSMATPKLRVDFAVDTVGESR